MARHELRVTTVMWRDEEHGLVTAQYPWHTGYCTAGDWGTESHQITEITGPFDAHRRERRRAR